MRLDLGAKHGAFVSTLHPMDNDITKETIEQRLMTMDELMSSHQRWTGFLRSRISDPASAEDILQSAYIKVLERGSELRDRESSVSWFYSVLRNAIIDHFRRNATRRGPWKRLRPSQLRATSLS